MTRPYKILALATSLAMTATAVQAAPPAPKSSSATYTTTNLAKACAGHDGWAYPAPPAHVFGNTWYVGTCGIAAILITGNEGHILIDGGVAEAAPLVLANIAKLGFKPQDVRWILSSHEHSDHAGALAAIKRATGAKLAAMQSAVTVLESGKPSRDDPQYGSMSGFDPVRVDRILADGDSVTLGNLAITAHATPVHSPGSTSWTWQSCTKDFACHMIAYADSATTISADTYRFTDHPDRVARIQEGLKRLAGLPCDLLMTPHPAASNLMERFAGAAPLVNPTACKTYAAAARQHFSDRLAKEANEAKD